MRGMKVITEKNVLLLERAVNEWITGNMRYTILGLQTAQGQGIDPNNKDHTFMTTILYDWTAVEDELPYKLASRAPESS